MLIDKIIITNSRNICIKITNSGEVILKKPKNYSEQMLNEFLNAKKSWIEANKKRILNIRELFKNVINYNTCLILGREVPLVLDQNVKNDFREDVIYAKNVKALVKLIKKFAYEYINARLQQLSKQMGVKYNEFTLENTRKRWGMCSTKNDIKINFRAICLEKYQLDYILIHELAHLKEFNHSKKFWNVVKKHVPDYLIVKKQISNYAFLLEMYR